MKNPPGTEPGDYTSLLPMLQAMEFEPNLAMRRQIAIKVRELILEEKLEYPTRLPPIRTLAKIWDSNYFTVQAALRQLVGEGLLTQSPKRGTFVAPPPKTIRRVCIYHDHPLRFEGSDLFHSLLNVWVYRVLAERGLIAIPFFDTRQDTKRTMPTQIREMLSDRSVDAVIATAIFSSLWLDHLNVPATAPLPTIRTGRVGIDYHEMARYVIGEAVSANRKRLGLILPPNLMDTTSSSSYNRALVQEFQAAARDAGIELILPPQQLDSSPVIQDWEATAYRLFEGIMSLSPPPRMIFVFPDSFMRGVATAILQQRLWVPSDLAIIAHRNEESPIYLPFPVTWISVKIEDFARAMVQQVLDLVEKPTAPERIIPCTLVRPSEQSSGQL